MLFNPTNIQQAYTLLHHHLTMQQQKHTHACMHACTPIYPPFQGLLLLLLVPPPLLVLLLLGQAGGH
jgi:hypothetical protein